MIDEFEPTDRVRGLRPTAVNRVLQAARKVEASGRPLVSLMRGQPDTPTPPHIVEAAIRSLRDGRTGYPDNRGEPALRRAVAEKLRRDQGLTYDPDREILITDGATLGIAAALGAMVDEARRGVMLPDPIYDAYAGPISLWRAETTLVPTGIADVRFALTREALEMAWSRPVDAILLNTPWNPVGTVMTRDELADILDFSAQEYHDHPILSDEIYETLVYDGRKHVSPAAISDDARGRTVVVNSLSKTYAMTGWRVGYCAGPEPIISAMFLILQQMSRGPATFVQDAAAVALTADQECTRRMAAEYQGRRDLVVDRLRGIPGVEPMVPEGGLFVMLDVRGLGRKSEEIGRFLMREAGVVVIPGSAYGARGEGTLRVSFAAGGEALDLGLERLREGLLRLSDASGKTA